MKKRKFNLLLNLASICLSIAAIVIGVYAIRNASLNLSGSVGFSAHNCDVYVFGKVEGGTQTGGSAKFGEDTSSGYINVHDTSLNTWNIGTILFDDLNNVTEGKTANDIVFTIKMYNASVYSVKATFNTNCFSAYSDKITVTASPSSMTLYYDQTYADVQTMTITLSLATTSDFSGITLSGASLINFEKSNAVKTQIDENKHLTMTMGHLPGNDNLELEWYAFAVLGENLGSSNANTYINSAGTWYSLEGVDMTNVNLENKTFWFVMKYVFKDTKDYGYSDYGYLESRIDTYLRQDDSSTTNFQYLAGLSGTKEYSAITTREIGSNEDIACTSKPATSPLNSKLWLLSVDEVKLVGANNATRIAYDRTSTSTAVDWGLRSTTATNSYMFAGITTSGEIETQNLGGGQYYRPGYQITLA